MVASDSGISKDSTAAGPTAIAIITFVAIALYNVIELNFIVFATFKRHSGLYFWSFIVSTWGIAVYAVGFLLKDLQLTNMNMFNVTLIAVGWCCMVTGQSVVLYSRLHLLLRNHTTLRAVLAMIIFDAIICHGPIIVMVYGANSSHPEPFVQPYSIYEKVQVTVFFIQELIISGLYIIETVKLFRLQSTIGGQGSRRTMTHLIAVNAIIVILDVTILALEYSGLYDIQTAYKGLVYSVKLKLEFSILNRLVELTKARRGTSYAYSTDHAGVVQLGTVDGEKRGRRGTGTMRSAVGYQASVHTGQAGDGNRQYQENGSVLMTKEVVVHREEARTDGESDRDSLSVGAGSGSMDNTTVPPRSSSQENFARTWN